MFKKVLLRFPEYYLVILVLVAAYKQPAIITVVLLALTGTLVLQIIYQNRILGWILATSLILINLYFLGALLSEFREFAVINERAVNLLLVGIPVVVLNFLAGGVMIYKYWIMMGNERIVKAIN